MRGKQRMTTTRGGFAKRSIAAVAVGLLGAASFSAAAFADPELSPSNIVGTEGSLTIHKHAGTPGATGDGTEITDQTAIDALGDGLEGVEFTIERAYKGSDPIDLTTFDGWNDAQEAIAGDAGYSLQEIAESPVTTGAGGIKEITNLPYGLYYVTETDPGDNPVVSMAEPFWVTIPYDSPAESEWIYDVHVYPKNKLNLTEPEKEVSNPDAFEIGAEVEWTVSAPVPELAAEDEYTAFKIMDTFDDRLAFEGVVVSYDGTTLVEGTDYDLTVNGQEVTIELTGAITDLEAGKDVVAVYTTTVTELGDGEISNVAFVNVNDSKHDQKTTEPKTNWGPLKLIKIAKEESGKDQADKTLEGAEFTVHETKGGPALTPPGTLTTDENGEIYVELWVGNDSTISKEYWLQETKAPAGYVLPEGDKAWTKVTVKAGNSASVSPVVVENVQQDTPDLPLTGSAGTVLLMTGGVALVLIAAGTAVVTNRRKNAIN